MVLKRGRNQAIGLFGETRIAEFRAEQGDEIVERNWRVREGEIDLVTLDKGGTFHFIEVKTRQSCFECSALRWVGWLLMIVLGASSQSTLHQF
jgi:Holliday junction resolvase-like predicted endonuclease